MPDEIEKFAFDTRLEEKIEELVVEYDIKSIVETGTWIGGTARAFAGMVENVYTIEVRPDFYSQAQQILAPLPNVKQFLGKTQAILPVILPLVAHPTLYYLDAHTWGAPGTAVFDELEIIAEHDPSPILVIHDFQVPGHPELKFDVYDGKPNCFERIEPGLRKIQTPWRHFFNSEAVGCRVGVLFVVPQKV